MTEPAIDFRNVTDQAATLLKGIEDAHLPGPTPCEGMTVAGLVNHMLGLTVAFTGAAKKERGPHTDTPPGTPPPEIERDWRTLLPGRLAALADAWADPAAWDGEATAGGVTMPARVTGLVALNEVAVHGWDLARATGQDYLIPTPVVETLLEHNRAFAEDPAAREGLYGPAVDIAPEAPSQDRLLGLTGRDPAWRP
ncbi:TIGR03086 family metal-binding protein [Glycomyces xiaoerkulensis]|uniref:TIGR03086 family metal-binding protein n=1 Tax=Glycomyces xiaoerkulensis TaxID=2038139 RepID=UPI000C2595F6|nr:TIGR03086 family metal-binding protein [Glycomyces xiaoerkulensis]